MQLEIFKCAQTGRVEFKGSYDNRDLEDLKFTPLQRKVLDQPAETASDILLNLEMIFRALELKHGEDKAEKIELVQDGGGA